MGLHTTNRWTSRFVGLLDRDKLRKRAQIAANPLKDLEAENPAAAYQKINAGLKSFCYLSEADVDVLEQILSTASSYCSEAYSSEAKFFEMLHLQKMPPCEFEPLCLASMAGLGKSELLKVADRLMPENNPFEMPELIPKHVDLRGCASITMQSTKTLHYLLAPLLPDDAQPIKVDANGRAEAKSKVKGGSELLIASASKHGYRSGIPCVLLDEAQFGTHSSVAIARIVSQLLTFSRLPMPFTYSINFDVAARLFDRSDHNHDRLICNSSIMVPPSLGSEPAREYLAECAVVLKNVLRMDLLKNEELMFQCSANVRRKVRWLLTLSYKQATKRKQREIDARDIEAAYASHEYAAMRQDVNAIFKQSLDGKAQPGRKDLWCPWGREFNILSNEGMKVAKKVTTDAMAIALQRQGMTQQEKGKTPAPLLPKKRGDAEEAAKPAAKNTSRKSNVFNLSQRNALDKNVLLRNTINNKGDK